MWTVRIFRVAAFLLVLSGIQATVRAAPQPLPPVTPRRLKTYPVAARTVKIPPPRPVPRPVLQPASRRARRRPPAPLPPSAARAYLDRALSLLDAVDQNLLAVWASLDQVESVQQELQKAERKETLSASDRTASQARLKARQDELTAAMTKLQPFLARIIHIAPVPAGLLKVDHELMEGGLELAQGVDWLRQWQGTPVDEQENRARRALRRGATLLGDARLQLRLLADPSLAHKRVQNF